MRRRAVLIPFVAGVVLATAGTFLAATYLGWWIHDQQPGRPVRVDVRRPVVEVQQSGTAAAATPNVLGLDRETARRALGDAGMDLAAVSERTREYAGETGIVVDQEPAPGEPREARATLEVSAPATMPAVAGRSVDAVREQLTELGARVAVRTRYEAAASEGDVLDSTPAAGARLTEEATLTVAEAPSSVFLNEIESIESACSQSEVDIDGRDFDNGITCSPGAGYDSVMEYALNRRVGRLATTIGLGDRGATDAPVRFSVFVDGERRFSETMRFGTSRRISILTEGGLRLRMETRLMRSENPDSSVIAAWGNPRLLGGDKALAELIDDSAP